MGAGYGGAAGVSRQNGQFDYIDGLARIEV
jgi:hypothetical protein